MDVHAFDEMNEAVIKGWAREMVNNGPAYRYEAKITFRTPRGITQDTGKEFWTVELHTSWEANSVSAVTMELIEFVLKTLRELENIRNDKVDILGLNIGRIEE